jgi:hypothetical protein
LTGDRWREVFPGKRILEELTRRLGLGNAVVFQNALLKEMATDRRFIPAELAHVIAVVIAGDRFSVPTGTGH